jgi:branched-chain amino acid transport system substrate-binding protein
VTVVRNKRGRATTVAVLGMVAMLAAACGDSGSEDSASSEPAADTSVFGEENVATGTPVKVGLYNVEGGSRVSLPQVGDAAVAAAEYANKYLGGIGGHEIEVVRCEDKADGASAAACANEFVQEGVIAVVAGQPAVTDQIVPVINGAGIPWVGSSPSGAAELGATNGFFFSSGFIGVLAAQGVYAQEEGYENFTLFGAENPQLVSTVNAVGKPLFKGLGVNLEVVTVPQGTADATSQITAGLQTKPDAVSVVADTTVCQSVLAALNTVGTTAEKIVTSACVDASVLDAIGESGIDGSTLFTTGDTTGDNEEANLYNAVMAEFAPDTEASGITPTGYLSMLGFIRAANSGDIGEGDVTPEMVSAAMKSAVDVPLPIGNGETFSCDANTLNFPAVKTTICNSKLFITTYKGLEQGEFSTVDAAIAFGG